MVPLHSRLTSNELASVLGVDVALIQVDVVLKIANGWLALVPMLGLLDSPERVTAKLKRTDLSTKSWWKKLADRMDKWPSMGWAVAAELQPDLWIWLGSASCNVWSQDDAGVGTGVMALDTRIPKDAFLELRAGQVWMDCGGGLNLTGCSGTSTVERLQVIMQQGQGDVFLQRWEGEVFGLQFDEKCSVFFVMPEGMNSMTYRYASCSGASCPPEAESDRLEMHCPCCGIEIGPFLPELHMSREFGFFVLSWLLDHHELPQRWTANAGQVIEWLDSDALTCV